MKHDLYSLENILNGSIEHTGLTAGEVHHMIGLSVSAVRRYANEDNIYHRTWRILQEAEWTDGECLEWDFLRAMVRHGLRHTRNFRKLRAYGEGEEMGKISLMSGIYNREWLIGECRTQSLRPEWQKSERRLRSGTKLLSCL